LNLSWCSELKELLTSIDKLIALQSLYFSRCSKLKDYLHLLTNGLAFNC
jgi:hypothetical protein